MLSLVSCARLWRTIASTAASTSSPPRATGEEGEGEGKGKVASRGRGGRGRRRRGCRRKGARRLVRSEEVSGSCGYLRG